MKEEAVRKNLKIQLEDDLSNLQYTRESHLKASKRLEKTSDWINKFQIGLSALSTAGVVSLFFSDTLAGKVLGVTCSAILFAISMYIKDKDLLTESKKHREAADKLFGIRGEYKLLLATYDLKDVANIEKSARDLLQETQKIYEQAPNCLNKDYEAAKESIKQGILLVTHDDKKYTVPETSGDSNVLK